MTVTATAPAAKAPAKRRTAKPANPVVTPEQAEEMRITARLEELKTAYDAARTGEAGTKKLLKSAKEAWENSRVITSRLAYAVAMLKPNDKGEANLSYAARELVMTAESLALTGQAYKDKQKSANSTLRNYVNAGVALDAAGLNPRGEEDKGNTAEPTAEERKVVAEAFRNGNKRDAQAPASTKDTGNGGDADGGENGESDAPAGSIPLTFADLSGHLGRLDATLKAMITAKVEVTAEQAEHAMAALGTLAMTLSEYVGLDADGVDAD